VTWKSRVHVGEEHQHGQGNTNMGKGDGARYVDNLLDGTAREIKSGKITLNGADFQRQIKKDIEIISQARSSDIQKIEWHALDGIDDNALQFIRTEMTKQGVSPDLFKVVIY